MAKRLHVLLVGVAGLHLALAQAACSSTVNVIEDEAGDGRGGAGASGSVTTGTTGSTSTTTSATSSTGSGGGNGPPVAEIIEQRCPFTVDWETVCITQTYQGLLAFNLATGNGCKLGEYDGLSGANTLVITGQYVIGCDGDTEGISRLDLANETSERFPGGCSSMTLLGDRWLVKRGDFQLFDSFDDAVVGATFEVLGIQDNNSRVGALGDRLYTAWHSTDELNRYDLANGNIPTAITLENFDGWVMGLVPLDDGRIVILSTMGAVHTFSETGESLATVSVDGGSAGLICYQQTP
jgi:hypothetical protein